MNNTKINNKYIENIYLLKINILEHISIKLKFSFNYK